MKFFVALAALCLAFGLAKASCPKIVTRSQWGARSANTAWLDVQPPSHVVIHHASSDTCTTLESCKRMVKSFQDWHMDGNGWADIGYNFLVGEDGNIYEGRGWGKTGAHAPGMNSQSIGICAIGTYNNRLPNAQALTAVKALIQCGVENGWISSSYRLIGHRQVSQTDCPGTALYNEIQNWPHFGSP